MLINLRNALMSGKRFPYDAEVEYLESTGTQWIDTGVLASQNTKIEARFYRAIAPSQFAYGVRSGSTTISCATGTGTSVYTTGYVRWGNSAYAAAIPDTEVVVVQDKDGVTVNGTHYNYTATESVVSQPGYTIALFAAKNSATTVTANLSGKFWYCKIWQNGVLVRDYIPVRKGTVGYLYDRVSGKLFGNAGTGDFVIGPDVVPVEYIESHGTEYIDTGVYGSDAVKATLDFQLISLGAARGVFGVYTSTSRSLYAYQSGNGSGVWQVGFGKYRDTAKRTDTERHNIELNDFHVDIDGETIATFSQSQFTTSHTMTIFATRNETGGVYRATGSRCYRSRIWQSNIPLRSFRPVRVGTGSTWEGAMMDVLTRRIYRNAGTGAFTYGNDLKYPIPAS